MVAPSAAPATVEAAPPPVAPPIPTIFGKPLPDLSAKQLNVALKGGSPAVKAAAQSELARRNVGISEQAPAGNQPQPAISQPISQPLATPAAVKGSPQADVSHETIRPLIETLTNRHAAAKQIGKLVSEIKTRETDTGAAMFSRQTFNHEESGEGIKLEDLRALSKSIKLAYPVHPSMSVNEWPVDLRAQVNAASHNERINAAFYDGEIWLAGDRVQSLNFAQHLILHEAEHGGLRGLFGDELNPMMIRIHQSNKNVRDKVSIMRAEMPSLSIVEATNEVLVEMSVNGDVKSLAAWDRFVAWVKDWLRRHGFTPEFVESFTDDDVVFLLERAWEIAQGKRTGQNRYDGYSAFSRSGEITPENSDIRFSRAGVMAGNVVASIPQPTKDYISRLTDTLLYNYVDNFRDLRKRVDAVKALAPVPESMDPGLQQELYSGRVRAKIDDFHDDMVNPMFKAIHDAKLKYEQVEEYLLAKHAPSRNAAMREINPTAPELEVMRAEQEAIRDELADNENVQAFIRARRELREAQAEVDDGIADESAVERIQSNLSAIQRVQEVRDYTRAIDRLRALRNITPYSGDNTALSGMSDRQAKAVIEKAGKDGKAADLERISAMIDAITSQTRRIYTESGLEKPETIAAWEAKYEHYVPLHRDEVGEGLPAVGQGFNIRGRESKRATGSEREVTNIMAHVIVQHDAAVIRAEKVNVDRALFDFIQANPDPIWSLDTAEMTKTVDPISGVVVEHVNPTYKQRPNVLTLKIDGEEHTITFDDSSPEAVRIAAAMKNLSARELGEVTVLVGKFTRLLATMNTSANPVFVARNFMRDLQTAYVNLSDTELADRKKEVFKNIPNAIRGFWQMSRGDLKGEWAKHAREFRDAGGMVGWLDHYKDIGERADKLKTLLADMGEGKGKLAKRTAFAYWNLIEDANAAVENGVRLAAYVTARRNGMSVARAASLAKNLTVNFNRKGAKGVELNMWYMFMNASIQGTARLVKAMGNKNVRKIIGYVIASGFMLDLLARALAGDDDDDGENDYDQLPEYVKSHNYVLWLGRPVTIPMPYGYNFFASVGRKMGEAMFRPNYSPGRSALDLMSAALDAFSPTGQSGSFLQLVSPTIADPFVQWSENKNFAGNPMRREQLPFGPPKPEYQMGFKSTGAPAKWLAELLNDLSGGNEVRPGFINLNPAGFDFAVTSVAGGAGRTYLQLISLPIKAVAGDDIQAREVPGANIFLSAKPEYQVERKFYESIRNVELAKAELQHYRGDPAKLRQLREEHGTELRMAGAARAYSTQLANLRKRERLLEKNEPEGWKDQTRAIEERKRALMSGFNKRYLQAMQ